MTTHLLDIGHRDLVSEYLSRFPPEISEHTFSNLFVWHHSRPIHFTLINETIVFLISIPSGKNQGFFLFGPPVGKLDLSDIVSAFKGNLSGAIRLPEAQTKSIAGSGFSILNDMDNDDYVYRVKDLEGLAGRNYAKKRNQIKKCLQQYNCEYEPISKALIPECKTMQEQWCDERSCTMDHGLCSEFSAINEMFDYFIELDLVGGVVRIDGKVQAFAIGEQLSPDTAVCHFEKAMSGIQGLGQLINSWFSRYSLGEFEFVNREQDLGIPGLRQAKQSYHPHHMVKKYTAIFSGEDFVQGGLPQGCAEEG
jgi:uncharacterized protein